MVRAESADDKTSERKLEELVFDNQTLRYLPVEPAAPLATRQVRGYCFSKVRPTPVLNPKLIAYSAEALSLLDLDVKEVDRPEFAELFCGNQLFAGSEPAAHSYCGYQFGHFSGQLGDGAAIYLGEVLNGRGERWELQLKGAGPTPYSRQGDGRKVLRSSVREFLCSEAMYHLGIPTTRAATVVTSDSRVERDPTYDGHPVQERCSIVSRLAPTFLRFGSFEIFKPSDPVTGRMGPSAGLEGLMLRPMLDFVVSSFYPDIWRAHGGDALPASGASPERQAMYLDFYCEVVRRTAQLVSMWQTVGWVHGVLNTDNMSIVGLTLDYGPFGFMDRYDPDFVSNGSDESGRYDYKGQPEICRWNCMKLAEALHPELPKETAMQELDALYDREFKRSYHAIMRRKLGLLSVLGDASEEDERLASDLLALMAETGADFTNTFRLLARFPMPQPSTASSAPAEPAPPSEEESQEDGGVLGGVMASLPNAATMAEASASRLTPAQMHMLLMLASRDPALLHAMGTSPQMITKEMEKVERGQKLRRMGDAGKMEADQGAWRAWLGRYRRRLQSEADARADPAERVRVMNATNPRFVLRNWIAQQAIDKAEQGDFSEVRRVLQLLRHPFAEEDVLGPEEDSQGSIACALRYDGQVPDWARKLCVTCSS